MPPKQKGQSEPPPIFGRGGPHAFGAKIERAQDKRGTVRRLWGYLKTQRAALIATAVIVVISTGLSLTGPFLTARAIDRYIMGRDLPGLARICALMLALQCSNALLMWLQTYIMAGASQRTVRAIRAELFGKLQGLPIGFFDSHAQGDIMSRLTNDVENINVVISDSVSQIVSGVLGMVGIAAAMFWMNATLAAISITTVTITTLLLNRWVAKAIRTQFRLQQAALGALNGLVEETISGQRVVKAYHRESAVMEQFDKANAELRHAATRAQMYSGTIGPMMNFIGNLSLAVVAGAGGALVVMHTATVGTVAGFINYTRHFSRPLNEIANLYNAIQGAIAGAERVFAVIDETPEADEPDAKPLPSVTGDVVFDKVSFSYDKETPVLRDVDLRAKPGQVVALVGPTGAGKTTVINLLSRFYDVDEGAILVDGQDIRTLQRGDLRRQLGIVLQDTYLFAGTVRDNIRYGRLDAKEEEIVTAARLANADQFIHRLPHGYDTVLQERGSNLSQGQRQLLAIARAILADHAILILDEATSSVDTRTEKHIQEAMRRLMAGRTSFVIAHRLSTIRDADQILVIDHGQVIESGTHDELLALGGFYARLSSGVRGGVGVATGS